MESLRSAAVITYEDCDSRRVSLSHTHAHSHTPNTCTNAEKRASGRPTNRLMASVRKAIHTTRN